MDTNTGIMRQQKRKPAKASADEQAIVLNELNSSTLKVLSIIWNEGPIARTDLAGRTGLAHSSITRITRTLEAQRLIIEVAVAEDGSCEPTRGRPKVMLAFNAEAGVVLAIDMSAIELQGAIYSTDGVCLYSREEPFDGVGETAVLRQTVRLIRELRARCAEIKRAVLAIAVSVPGVIDQVNGRIVEVTNLDLHNFNLADALSREFVLPVFIEHDTMAAAYAERFYGAGIENDSLIYILVSQGIGAGFLLKDQIYRGVFGAAGELGHVTIQPDGPLCLCGRRGCLEALAGAQAILEFVRNEISNQQQNAETPHPTRRARSSAHWSAQPTMEEVVQAAAAGDPIAHKALSRTAKFVAQAIGMLVTTLDVRCVIVGGEVAEAGERFFTPLNQNLPHFMLPGEHAVKVYPSQLKQEAAIKGASILALHRVLGIVK